MTRNAWRWCAGGAIACAALVAGGCGGSPKEDPKARSGGLRIPGPSERLHPPGELRLTSAGSAPRTPIRYRFVEGQWLAFRTALHATYSGGAGAGQVRATFDWERRVRKVDRASAQVRFAVRRVRRVRPSSLRQQILAKLLGVGFVAQMDPRGRVRRLQPGDVLGPQVSLRSVVQLSTPLPEDPVGDGATWERSETWRTTLPKGLPAPLLRVQIRYALRLIRRRGKVQRAQVDATMHMAAQSPPGSADSAVRASGQGTARLVIDLERGVPLRGRTEATYRVRAGDASTAAVIALRSRTWKIRIPRSWRRAESAR